MEKKQALSINEQTKVLVPAIGYDFSADKRLLIPFTERELIGFVNREGEVVVKPQFAMYYGDCYAENDYIRVVVIETFGFPKSGGKVSTYQRPLYGLINHKGEFILEPTYQSLTPAIGNKNLFTVELNWKYGVLTALGEEIVPLGKYDWIDGYDNGLARVNIKNNTGQGMLGCTSKWGIIDEKGNEVLPVEYDSIWNFYGKNRTYTKVVQEGKERNVSLLALLGLNDKTEYEPHYSYDRPHYEDFAGTYAQDVAGYSDEAIYDAFEGDPDAYWNID